MAKTVTVEGTLTPSTYLARGQRATVSLTPEVERKVRRGYIKIVKVHDDELTDTEREADEQAELAREARSLAAPNRSASRDDWAEFLAAYPLHGFVTEGKNRADLIAEWDLYIQNPEGDGVIERDVETSDNETVDPV